MKIQDAKKAYAAQMDTLWTRKRALSQALKNCQQGGAPNVDRVEISRELSTVDAQYNEAQGVMESIIERETAIHNAEVAKQQGNALSKAAKEMGKMLEIYRRIASGGQVPPEDEQRLMEYNHELYMAAKTAAMLQEGDGEKYESLFEDEEEKNGEEKTASEIAGEAEISVPVPGVSGVAGVSGVGSDGVSDGVSVPGSVSSGGDTISPVSGSIRLPFSSVI